MLKETSKVQTYFSWQFKVLWTEYLNAGQFSIVCDSGMPKKLGNLFANDYLLCANSYPTWAPVDSIKKSYTKINQI